MSDLAWRFPISDDGEEHGINDGGIATFKGSELYDNLAREICQNSLDAKAPGEETVIVEFNSLTLKKSQHSALVGLDSVIHSCEEYWSKKSEPKLTAFLNEAKEKLSREDIEFLVISDYNTKGLSGSKVDIREKSVWRALTHSSGVTQKEQGSGGSYGIGKNAPFACSSFRTVFYNSYALDDGVKAFQGVARLVTHFQNGQATQGVGFFQNSTAKKPIFENDICLLRDQFARKDYGTDVIIAGFKKTENWAEDIEKAVLSNFFVAIIKKKLVVKINGLVIDDKKIQARLRYYADIERQTDSKDKRITTIMEFYSAVVDPDDVKYGSIIENDDVVIHIKKDDSYSKSIAQMRSIGMVVRIRHNHIFTRYAAVMIVQGQELNELLKSIEPPQHNKWDPDLIDAESDPKGNKRAKRIRTQLISWANDIIIECCRSETPEEIDLDIASAYLPYDEDDSSLGDDRNDSKDESPDTTNDVGTPKVTKVKTRTIKLTATKVKGTKNEDMDPSNEEHGGKGHGSGGEEDPDGLDDVKAPTPGNKAVNVPKVLTQRIIQMPTPSTYRVALVLEEDCPVVNLSLKAIGDDGTKEKITIKDFKIDRNKTSINSSVVTLRDIKAKTQYEVFLYLEYSEKMLLELLVY